MRYHLTTLLFIVLVGLTACGGTPEQVNLDRRYLNESQLAHQLADIKADIAGVVLDEYVWISGENKVFTLLTREYDATENYGGIFLRHFRVGEQSPELLWTYQDSISCTGAVAGANLVKNQSPELRPASWLGDKQDQFVLRYELGCADELSRVGAKTLVVIDSRSGTPEIRMEAGLGSDQLLGGLPAEKAARLRALWEETVL